MEFLVFFAAACGAPVFVVIALPGAIAYILSRRGRPLFGFGGENACGSCGYDLAGLTADTCPECGRPFRRVVDHAASEG